MNRDQKQLRCLKVMVRTKSRSRPLREVVYVGFLICQKEKKLRMAYVDLFQPPMKGPFEIPNPRVWSASLVAKWSRRIGRGRGGWGRGLNKVRLPLTAPLPEGLPGQTGPAEGPEWSTPECTARGEVVTAEQVHLRIPCPSPPPCPRGGLTPPPTGSFPGAEIGHSSRQAGIHARRGLRTASETSATRGSKPRRPPRPRGEPREPSPASLPSPLGHPLPEAPRIPPEAS